MSEIHDGETVHVVINSKAHTLKRCGNIYSCTCTGWQRSKKPEQIRTCKHLKEYLGEPFELSRTDPSSANSKLLLKSPDAFADHLAAIARNKSGGMLLAPDRKSAIEEFLAEGEVAYKSLKSKRDILEKENVSPIVADANKQTLITFVDVIASFLSSDEGRQQIANEMNTSSETISCEQIKQWLADCDLVDTLEGHVRDRSNLYFKVEVAGRAYPSVHLTRPKENCCVVVRTRDANIHIEAYLNKTAPPLYGRKVSI